jgi:GH18 family chitinase
MTQFRLLSLFLLVLVAAACTTPAVEEATPAADAATPTATPEPSPTPTPPFRIIGYVTTAVIVDLIPFDKLTHINYAFAIPKPDGTLQPMANGWKLDDLVAKAHEHSVQVLIAVGGWGHDATFETLAADPQARDTLVQELVALVEKHNLDGIDMDWEYPDPNTESADNFLALMADLGAEMRQRDKLLTAAVAALGYNADGVVNPVFDEVDFLNLMVYDESDGDHASLNYAQSSLAYWQGRGLPADKMVLGVPFYGRPNYLTYANLVESNPQATNQDAIDYLGSTIYYNGIPTMQQKTEMALTNASGIMIWTLEYDTQDETSLLQAIYQTAHEK